MVSVQISPSQFKDISEAEEQEAQELAQRMLRPGKSFAKYSQYASTPEVRQRLLYFWNQSGIRDVMNFQAQLSQQGIKPVIVKGIVTGYEDTRAGVSVPVKLLPKYLSPRNLGSRTYQELVKQQFRERFPDTRQSIKQQPINIFRPESYARLGEALRQSKARTPTTSLFNIAKRGMIEPLLATSRFIPGYIGITKLPSNLAFLIKNPSNIKNIPSSFKTEFQDTIQLIKTSPSEAIGKIGANIYTGRIIAGGFQITGKVASNLATRISPKFVGIAKTGANLVIKRTATGKQFVVKVVGKIPTESLAKQIGREGTTVSAISSQADNLVGLIRRKKIIMKPLGEVEKKLSKEGKNLLKKFDKGTINSNQLIRLDKLLKKAGSKGILERSFFADPNLRIRPSRLGVIGAEKEATFRELLSGKATLRKSKPQILLFEDIKIQKLPKSLNSIKRKLLKNKALSESEMNKLLIYQQKITGKFKPVGFVTREAEITLAPGEMIKRVKKVGVTIVNGKRVPIISTKVIKLTKSTKKLLKKVQSGKSSVKELKKLSRKLKKETGFKYSTSSLKKVKKYFPIRRKALSSITRIVSKYKIPKSYYGKRVNYSSSGKPYIKTKSGRSYLPKKYQPKIPPYYPPKYPLKYPKIQPPYSPPYKPPKVPPKYPAIPKKAPFRYSRTERKLKKLSKSVPVFNVYGKSGKKFIKLNTKPLSRSDALSRGAFAVDYTTSRSFKIIPAGRRKKVGGLRKQEENYFNRMGYKFREYKVKRGRKFVIKPRYIERVKHAIDKKSEVKGLSIAKFIRQKSRGSIHTRRYIVRRAKRRINPTQRRVMLRNLAKARRILAKRRKRRRR